MKRITSLVLLLLSALFLPVSAHAASPDKNEAILTYAQPQLSIDQEKAMILDRREFLSDVARYQAWEFKAAVYAAVLEQARADERQRARVAAAVKSTSDTPSTGNHDPCAEPINGLLPDNIVQRESSGQCNAYNHGGCGGRGCLGWAQIDEGHFWADSPWGSGPGSCYGLSYNGCVSKLSNGGTNLDPWKCC